MAGRVAENTALGNANLTTAGAADVMLCNTLCRAMIFQCAWSPTIGPVSVADTNEDMLSGATEALLGDMSPQTASSAMAEMQHMMRSAEAKAYYGLLTNWKLFGAMVDAILAQPDYTLHRYASPIHPFPSSVQHQQCWGSTQDVCRLVRIV